MTWRVPQVLDRPMAIDAILPEGCEPRRGPVPVFDGRAFVSGWITTCKAGLAGGEIVIEGLERTRTDVRQHPALRTPDRLAVAGGGERINEPSIFLGEISQDKIDDHSFLHSTAFNDLDDDDIKYVNEDYDYKPGSFLKDIDDL